MKLYDILKICQTSTMVSSAVIVPKALSLEIFYTVSCTALGECLASPSEDVSISKAVYIRDIKQFLAATKLKFKKLFIYDDVQIMVERATGYATVLYEPAAGMGVTTFNPQQEPELYGITINSVDLEVLRESLETDKDMRIVSLSSSTSDGVPVLVWKSYETPNNDYRCARILIPVSGITETDIKSTVGYDLGIFDFPTLLSVLKSNKNAEYCNMNIFMGAAIVMTFYHKSCENKVTIFSK